MSVAYEPTRPDSVRIGQQPCWFVVDPLLGVTPRLMGVAPRLMGVTPRLMGVAPG